MPIFTIFTRGDHLSFLSLYSGLSWAPTSCFSSYFLWCGCWEVNVSRMSLSTYVSCLSNSSFCCGFSIWQQMQPQGRLLTSPFVEETVISPATNRNKSSLNHKSLFLCTIMLRDDLKLFLVIIFLHLIHNVTALFPESTSGQNSHFPPKYYWVFIEYFSFFVKQGS